MQKILYLICLLIGIIVYTLLNNINTFNVGSPYQLWIKRLDYNSGLGLQYQPYNCPRSPLGGTYNTVSELKQSTGRDPDEYNEQSNKTFYIQQVYEDDHMPVEGRLGPQDLDSDVEFTESNPNTEYIYKVYINEYSLHSYDRSETDFYHTDQLKEFPKDSLDPDSPQELYVLQYETRSWDYAENWKRLFDNRGVKVIIDIVEVESEQLRLFKLFRELILDPYIIRRMLPYYIEIDIDINISQFYYLARFRGFSIM